MIGAFIKVCKHCSHDKSWHFRGMKRLCDARKGGRCPCTGYLADSRRFKRHKKLRIINKDGLQNAGAG